MQSSNFTYRGVKTREISFPLGGIGTGCIGLAGNGRLIDWEIFNRPNKGSTNGYSHFAIKAETAEGDLLDARVLHGDVPAGSYGQFSDRKYTGFGFGVPREIMAGVPHFKEVVFTGEFPLAHLQYLDAHFPAQVECQAFNPFIPLNALDSALPAAFFEFTVTNPTSQPLVITLAGSLFNPLPVNNLNAIHTQDGITWLNLASDDLKPDDPGFGTLCLATDAPAVSSQAYWYRGSWFDALEIYWRDFTAHGSLCARSYPADQSGKDNCGTLAVHFTLAAGEVHKVRYLISWCFPNFQNYWEANFIEYCKEHGLATVWKNHYATIYPDAAAAAQYGLQQWNRLYTETRRFKDTLFASDLPPVALEAISANISILKTPVAVRLQDGTFYGWEGLGYNWGCCEGTCTHVWNYAQALPFLFPKLERTVRESDYAYNQRQDGAMRFRITSPMVPADDYFPFRACADGAFGGALKVYRDWKICADLEWLRHLWPGVKNSIAYAWAETNPDRWDPQQTGVLHGRVHHTLDMELFGPDAWLTGFYLAALKAGAEMAAALGDDATAQLYQQIFARGKVWVEANLFNGEYYEQQIDLADKSRVDIFNPVDTIMAGRYWDDEHQEIKYQIAGGCALDQVLPQWHANLYGLGEVLNPQQVRSALKAIYKYNFVPTMREHFNPHRIFALDDEGGLLICAYPEGHTRPAIPIPYAHETMTGFEYAAAIQMIQNGMIQEGMKVVTAIRDRYDGEKRNPWNEIECGSNYARAMASYALLNAFSGLEFDLNRGMIGFHPIVWTGGQFRCFWSLGTGWGEVIFTPGKVVLKVLYGYLDVSTLRVVEVNADWSAILGDMPVSFKLEHEGVVFSQPVHLEPGQDLVLWK